MRIIETVRRRVEGLLTAPAAELGRWARLVRFQVQLWRFCGRRLREHNSLAMSSALSFRTIFALVPSLVLALVAMKSLGMLGDREAAVRRALRAVGLHQIYLDHVADDADDAPPASGAAEPTQPGERVYLADKIIELVGKVERQLTFERIGPVGVLLLIWSALTLLTTIERSLNRIFGAARARPLGRRLLLYWSVVTLGPVLLVAATYLGGGLASAFGHVPAVSLLLRSFGWAGGVVIGVVLVTGLYKLMPNTHVRLRAAIGGSVVAVSLWLLAQWGFALYLRRVALGNLYGTLGLLPLSLIWLNLSWLIFLFGAELAHTAVSLARMRTAELAQRALLGPSDLLAVALAVARPYAQGLGPARLDRIAAAVNLPDGSVRRLLDRLADAAVVCAVGSQQEAYVLARPAERILLAEVMDTGGSGCGPGREEAISQALAEVRSRTDAAISERTLADLLGPGAR